MSWTARKYNNLATVLILSLLIIFVAAAGTLAYFVDSTDSLDNSFVPVSVSCQPTQVSGGIGILNSGEIDAYIRATVVVNWVLLDAEGNATNTYHSSTPVEGIDYQIEFDQTGAWIKHDDGFWYHRTPVGAGATTEVLLSGLTRLTEAPEGYKLSVEVLSTGIQSTPTAAVEEAWGVTVDGIIIVN
jgi:hypothetical protein